MLPRPTEELFIAGSVNPTALIVGANTKDGTSQFYPSVVPAWNSTPATYGAALAAQYGSSQAAAVEAQYPLSTYHWPSGAFLQTVADKRLFCPSRSMAEMATAAGTTSWVYTFAHGPWYGSDGVARDFLSSWQTGYELEPPGLRTGWGAHATDGACTSIVS